jgi:YesN/AraC family two-component response regulator
VSRMTRFALPVILIVDPAPGTLRSSLRAVGRLVERSGIAQAVTAIQEHQPVVTIIEYQLADGCGLDLLKKLRSKHLGTVPVMATASGSERICAAAFRLGAADYWIKPISPPDLLETIRPLLHRAPATSELAANSIGDSTPHAVRTAARILETQCDEPLSLNKLAEVVGLDRFELSRQFTRTMGRCIRTYLAECRIARAKELLLTDCPITDVAQMVGYGDLPRFDKMFRAVTGSSPSEFRRTAKNDKGSTTNY